MPTLCRDCLHWNGAELTGRCPECRSPRMLAHPELGQLGIAHVDADAFYASVEKRDAPELADRPVIVGGGRRGVVTTCCYIARIAGVRSAMPMFKALARCPDAAIVRPRMEVYAAESAAIRARMSALTPLVEPLSLDEAFLDLSGTDRLFGHPPAVSLARLALEIEEALGLTVSVGLSHNKFLAKTASDLDKPRGFSVLGVAETLDFLAPRPIRSIWGVGAATAAKLEADGLRLIADLRLQDPSDLVARYGSLGSRLHALAHGRDARDVRPDRRSKSISSETTFEHDLAEREPLEGHLWRLSVKVSDRAKAKQLAGSSVTLKLKTAAFRTLTRTHGLDDPTDLADRLYHAAEPMLGGVLEQGPFRLIGIGLTSLSPADGPAPTLLIDDPVGGRAQAERVSDDIRRRYGPDSIFRGRALR